MNDEKREFNNNTKVEYKQSIDSDISSQIVTLKIEGMDCNDESEIIKKKLKKLTGIQSYDINLMTQQVKITYNPTKISIDYMIKEIGETGMKALQVNARILDEVHSSEDKPSTQTVSLRIEGMCCSDESKVIEKKLKKLTGIRSFNINLMTQQVKITYDPTKISIDYMIKEIGETGMKASEVNGRILDEGHSSEDKPSTQTVSLKVEGMDCNDESEVIEKKLKKLTGIQSFIINLMSQQVKISYDPSKISIDYMIKEIGETGMKASRIKDKEDKNETSNEGKKSIQVVSLKVEGMDCNDESEVIEKKLNSLIGIQSFDINLMSQQLKVIYNPALISIQVIIKEIAETGMNAYLIKTKTDKKEKKLWKQNKQLISLSFCGILIIIAFLSELFGVPKEITRYIYGIAVLIGIYYPAKMGILALRTLTLNIRLLMTIGAIGSIILGLWEESALLVFVYSLGDVLELYAVDKARGAIKKLMELTPKEALVRRNGKEIEIPTIDLKIGDIAIIKPGDKIPIDGKVILGTSFVDQSTITGESIPVPKNTGDEVFAGTINQKGTLEIEITKVASDTTLARIIKSVEEAQAKKSSYQRFAERFGKYYTPAMFLLGICVALIPPLFFGGEWTAFIYRGLIVFVVSCSCGLALSVPVSVVSAIANSAHNGVLFKGGAYLEAAHELKAIAFDKTGTLTIGRAVLTDIITYNNQTESEILVLAGSIESRSEHPVADAIVQKTKELSLSLVKIDNFEAIPGQGVKAMIQSSLYYIGNPKLFQANNISLKIVQNDVERLEKEGKTTVIFGNGQKIFAILAVADRIRSNTRDVMQSLKNEGIRTIMLTGDNERTADAIAFQAGIDEHLAQLMPEEKLEAIKKLKTKYGKIAMVGDGINDTPAMAASDVGIAMGAAGTDIAIETGDIVLMTDDLSKISYALRLSKRTMNNIRQNIILSLSIVIILVPLAVFGGIGLVPGLLLNEASGLFAIFNALRLLKK